MPNDDAAPIIIFIASVYAFGIVLLYVLARAWEQALSTRPRRREAVEPDKVSLPPQRTAAAINSSQTMSSKALREDVRGGG
jgi:hypothetical protein